MKLATTATTTRPSALSTISESRARARQNLACGFTTRSIAVRLFVTCWLVYGLHFATNTVREIYPALSLGDRSSFEVSEYQGLHPDIFVIPERGAYINNNPGASIVGAVPYFLTKPIIDPLVARVERKRVSETTANIYDSPYPMAREFYERARARGLDVKFGLAAAVIQIFAMAPLSALSVVVMFYILIALKVGARTALVLALLYAFATPIFFRTGQLNQNLLIAHCALFAFATLWRPWDADAARRPNYLLAGLLCGWAVVLDYSGIVVVLVLALYAWLRRRQRVESLKSKRDYFEFISGVAVCAAVLMFYQWSSFGNPLFPAQRYMPPTEFSVRGYNGMTLPQLDLLWLTAFDFRYGLFTSAPLLLVGAYIPYWLKREHRLIGSLEIACCAAFTTAFFIFCASNQFGRLQFNSGVRYIVPVVPFMFLLTAGVLTKMPRVLFAVVAVVATYWSWCLAMYRDVEQGAGVFEAVRRVTFEGLRLPWLTTLERMSYVAEGASPLILFAMAGAVIVGVWTIGERRETATERV